MTLQHLSRLRKLYQTTCRHVCPLSSADITNIWNATTDGRRRTVAQLQKREATAITRMREAVAKQWPPLAFPFTLAQYIAEAARYHSDAYALAEARRLARRVDDNREAEQCACEFVDHSRVIFFTGKLFTVQLHFDIPGESGHDAGIEPPWLSPWNKAEEKIFNGRAKR